MYNLLYASSRVEMGAMLGQDQKILAGSMRDTWSIAFIFPNSKFSMERVTEKPRGLDHKESIEDIALRASYQKEFQHIVLDAPSRGRAVIAVCGKLNESFFPEITKLPKPDEGSDPNVLAIAKAVVNLLLGEGRLK
jgi:hypothetical protein